MRKKNAVANVAIAEVLAKNLIRKYVAAAFHSIVE